MNNVTDFSDSSRTKESARANEQKMAAIFAQAAVGLSEISLDGRFLQVNDEICRILDRPREEILTLGVPEVTHPDDLPNSLESLRQVIERGHSASIDKRYIRPDGKIVWATSSLTRLDDETGQPYALIVVTVDLTGRREAEERLRKIEGHLANAQRIAALGSWSRDIESDRLFWSEEMHRIYGFPPETEITVERWFNAIHPADRSRVSSLITDALAGKAAYDVEYRILKTDGKERVIHAIGEVTFDANYLPVKTSGTSQDITERKQTEEALRKSEERLHQSQKLESIGRLAGGIAHDFNNMLTAILGYSDLTLQFLGKNDLPRKNIEEIKKAGERSAALTKQLLAFSRKQILQPQLIDLNRLIADTKNILQQVITENIRLVIAATTENASVTVDLGQLTQVIINLVANAKDAMPEGGQITIATEPVNFETDLRARFDYAAPGEYVKLIIIDTGAGMAEETLAHIFEPFYTTKEMGLGTGLGLATVYGIVKQSKGFIAVDSRIGEGSAFSIYLPLAAKPEIVEVIPDKKPVQAAAEPVQAAREKEIILLVEDEVAVRTLISEVLKAAGFAVIQAENGLAALALAELQESKIDLLITDVVMPEMSGRELAEEIKRRLPQLKILFMSGYTDHVVMRHGISEDGINFIQKPFSPDELAGKVRSILDN